MRLAGLTLVAVLALPSAAFADATVQATDGTLPDGSDNRWTPNALTIKAGETVTWSFAGTTIAHNVKSAAGWDLVNAPAVAGPPATYTFTTPGTYEFFCQLHATPMRGTITVTDATGTAPPPPPPPPLSEQPFVNDFPGPTVLEVRDTVAPTLDRVTVTRARKSAKVRVRLSEAGKVAVELTRGKLVKRRTVEVPKGSSSFTVTGLRAGTYRVKVSASDLAGNAAKASKRTRITIR
ncbi:cupredoxin domain-containing protein [Solirubrobacter soli]|uniref:cupredoxin domain-containing protein n=1 Tax=Solirubrobacter soli TaxID=363832 RepID=UPI0004096FC9|nr:cupredoxin domain-containing protein [Solirubrobacter soli]